MRTYSVIALEPGQQKGKARHVLTFPTREAADRFARRLNFTRQPCGPRYRVTQSTTQPTTPQPASRRRR
jgi:hypothetical protein